MCGSQKACAWPAKATTANRILNPDMPMQSEATRQQRGLRMRKLAPPLLATLVHARTLTSAVPQREASWKLLKAYADDPMAFADDTKVFSRDESAQKFYDEYKAWCKARGLSTSEDVQQSVEWVQPGRCQHRVCLEPNWAPYRLESPIEHWVLWHDPDAVKGDTELHPEVEKIIIRAILGDAFPNDSHIVVFQNIPSRRSLHAIAHSHIFFNVAEGTELERALSEIRVRWEERASERKRAVAED